MRNQNLLGYFAGKYMCEISLSEAPCRSEGSFSQCPSAAHIQHIPLDLVVLHSNTSTPVQKLWGPEHGIP